MIPINQHRIEIRWIAASRLVVSVASILPWRDKK
jgi:hypothetical protein